MTSTPVFAAHVDDDGRLHPERLVEYLRHLRTFAGQRVEIVVRKPRVARSDRQNRYYWGVVIAIFADHLGYTAEELHEALKLHFLKDENPDRPLPTMRSTTRLSTGEFERYLEQIRTFASTDFGVYIPEPNEVDLP